MIGDSVREQIVLEIVKRLKKIRGAPGYNYAVDKVERRIHQFDGSREYGNTIGVGPTILVATTNEEASFFDLDQWDTTIDIELTFLFQAQRANDEDVNNALSDMLNTVFTDPTTSEYDASLGGLGSRPISFSNTIVEPGATDLADGLVLTLRIGYLQKIGDTTRGVT